MTESTKTVWVAVLLEPAIDIAMSDLTTMFGAATINMIDRQKFVTPLPAACALSAIGV
jgi:hypothetical protein